MAKDTDSTSQPDVGGIKRVRIGANVVIQIAATVLILLMINYLAFNHFKRWDVSHTHKYTLSDKSRKVLRSLNKPVKMIIFFTSGSDILGDVDNLLKEYQYASKRKIEVETVDVFRHLTRAREIANKYKVGGNENVVVVDYDGRSKVINAFDMADYDTMGAEMFNERARLKAFKGEQVITSALVELSEQSPNKACVLEGHGEPQLGTDALSIFKTYVDRENIKLEALNLMNVEKIPGDAKALIVIGPKYDFTDREMKMLGEYWDRKGRLLIALDPAAPVPKLSAFLAQLGVTRNDDRILTVIDIAPGLKGIVPDPTANFIEGSPATRKLEAVTTQFIGGTQSLAIDERGGKARGLRLQKLVVAAKGFWGETDYQNKDNVSFDPKKDHPAPLTIAASVEKGAPQDPRIKVDSSRMVVVGNSVFLTSDALRQASPNVDFAINALNWLLAREEIIGITPKEEKTFALNLSDAQVKTISLITFAGFLQDVPRVGDFISGTPGLKYIGFLPLPGLMPLLVALIGYAVWWKRRR